MRIRSASSAPPSARSDTSASSPPPNIEWPVIATRSLARVPTATFQPSVGEPTRNSSGMKTSSRKTSLNSASPVSSRSGRTVMPGELISSRK